MTPHTTLVAYKRWEDKALYDIIAANLSRLDAFDHSVLMQIIDHMYAVDCIFQHHLLGKQHGYTAPRSNSPIPFEILANRVSAIDNWYIDYALSLSDKSLNEMVDFVFTNGSPARMTRGDMILHVCMHGTYHRGNVGIILQKNGIKPNNDRLTDFLEKVA